MAGYLPRNVSRPSSLHECSWITGRTARRAITVSPSLVRSTAISWWPGRVLVLLVPGGERHPHPPWPPAATYRSHSELVSPACSPGSAPSRRSGHRRRAPAPSRRPSVCTVAGR